MMIINDRKEFVDKIDEKKGIDYFAANAQAPAGLRHTLIEK